MAAVHVAADVLQVTSVGFEVQCGLVAVARLVDGLMLRQQAEAW